MGDYDLPAFFEFILANSDYKKIAYIGFSQSVGQMNYALAGGCYGN